jgi:hypothetical protein
VIVASEAMRVQDAHEWRGAPGAAGKRLGEILVGLGFLTPSQLEDLLAEQARTGWRLGAIVVARKHVAPTQLAWVLGTQLGLQTVRFEANSVDRSLLAPFPVELLRSLLAVPRARTDEGLTVAMADPTDAEAIEKLSELAGQPLRPCLALAQNISAVLTDLDETPAPLPSPVPDALRPRSAAAVAPDQEPQPARPASAPPTSAPLGTGGVTPGSAGDALVNQPLRELQPLLQAAVELGASDLHLSANDVPWVRRDGALERLTAHALNVSDMDRVRRLLLHQRPDLEEQASGDLRLAAEVEGVGRIRASLFAVRFGGSAGSGWAVACRPLPHSPPELGALGLPPAVGSWADKGHGLVLVTGPTGSGRSTTLAALVDRINQTRAAHIITVEQPVEFRHESRRSLVHHREVGRQADTWSSALRGDRRAGDPAPAGVGAAGPSGRCPGAARGGAAGPDRPAARPARGRDGARRGRGGAGRHTGDARAHPGGQAGPDPRSAAGVGGDAVARSVSARSVDDGRDRRGGRPRPGHRSGQLRVGRR